jgi:hypothetical protein
MTFELFGLVYGIHIFISIDDSLNRSCSALTDEHLSFPLLFLPNYEFPKLKILKLFLLILEERIRQPLP